MIVFVPDDPSAFLRLLQTSVSFVVLPLPRTRRTSESSNELSSYSVKGVSKSTVVYSRLSHDSV